MKYILLPLMVLTGCTSLKVVEKTYDSNKTITFKYRTGWESDRAESEVQAKAFCGSDIKVLKEASADEISGMTHVGYGNMAAVKKDITFITYKCL